MSKIYLIILFLILSTSSYSSVSVCHKLLAKEAQKIVALEHKLELEQRYIRDGFVHLFKELAQTFEYEKALLKSSFKQNICRNDQRLHSKREFFEAKFQGLIEEHQLLMASSLLEIKEISQCDVGLIRLKKLYSEVVDQYDDKALNNFNLLQAFTSISFDSEFYLEKNGCPHNQTEQAKEILNNSYLMIAQLNASKTSG